MVPTLAELRKAAGLTQKELAEALGLSQSTIAMYETGERKPLYENHKKIAEFFGLNLGDIFFGRHTHEM